MKEDKNAQAEGMLRGMHAVHMRVLGAEHPDTLLTAGSLSSALSDQGKYAESEMIQREMLVAEKRVLGA